tara:strand:+ start:233 stop:463 length:231 start_codon:yes stop_codon:yes gene_type:complete
MAKKYVVKEGILTKFVGAITSNIINNQRAKNKKALKNDKELQRLENEAAKSLNNLKDYVDDNTDMSRDDFIKKFSS